MNLDKSNNMKSLEGLFGTRKKQNRNYFSSNRG